VGNEGPTGPGEGLSQTEKTTAHVNSGGEASAEREMLKMAEKEG
jgi:hypothetical protein